MGIHAGQQALMAHAYEKTAVMMRAMGDEETALFCDKCHDRVASVAPYHNFSKQAAALQALWGLADPKKMNEEVIAPNGAHGYSTFLGWATLNAKAVAGDLAGAIADMKEYWGAMLDLGATTFWEDFNLIGPSTLPASTKWYPKARLTSTAISAHTAIRASDTVCVTAGPPGPSLSCWRT